MNASAADSVVGGFSDCPHCGAERVEARDTRIVFTDAELGMVERFLEGRCFPCWYSENVLPAHIAELETKLNRLRKKYPGKVARIPKNRRYG